MEASQLAQVEALCETLYTGVPTKSADTGETITRNEAQQRLLSLQSSAEYIPQCQYILDKSTSQYARLVATNSLTELITVHWNSFTIPQRIDIRNYVLGYLANQGPTLQDFVVVALIKLVCRITKLGWFDDPVHRELADDVTKFLQATVDHCILGLKILNQLVDELNIPTTGRTLTQHRKTSVSFRDVCLLKVFQLGFTTLKQLQTRSISKLRRKEGINACVRACVRAWNRSVGEAGLGCLQCQQEGGCHLSDTSYQSTHYVMHSFLFFILQAPINDKKPFWENKPCRFVSDALTLTLLGPIQTNPPKM
jgi:hypothetical protein